MGGLNNSIKPTSPQNLNEIFDFVVAVDEGDKGFQGEDSILKGRSDGVNILVGGW